MNKKSLQIIASWLLLVIGLLPIAQISIHLLIAAWVAGIIIALITFFPWKTSFPWLLILLFLIAISKYKIPGYWSDRTRLIILLGLCVVGLALTSQLYLYNSLRQVRQARN